MTAVTCLNVLILSQPVAAPEIQKLDVIINPKPRSTVLSKRLALKTIYHNDAICSKEKAKTLAYTKHQATGY